MSDHRQGSVCDCFLKSPTTKQGREHDVFHSWVEWNIYISSFVLNMLICHSKGLGIDLKMHYLLTLTHEFQLCYCTWCMEISKWFMTAILFKISGAFSGWFFHILFNINCHFFTESVLEVWGRGELLFSVNFQSKATRYHVKILSLLLQIPHPTFFLPRKLLHSENKP